MFLGRLICRVFGHAPWERCQGSCSRCGRELPAARYAAATSTMVPAAQRGPMLPWWFGTHGPTPPGWREPSGHDLRDARLAEYDGGWNRIFEGRERE